jgi:hypothetical protein
MSETRPPEAMPIDWTVASFAHEKGFGALVHPSGEQVIFNIDVWNLGSWKPSRKDAGATGPDSPLLPKQGEVVRVRWKRSVSGKNVPCLVEPAGRLSADRNEYKLSAWLKGVQKHAGKFAGLTPKDLLKALSRLDEDRAEEWKDGEPREASDFAFLLMDFGNLADVDPQWASTHAEWIYSDDHRWDRERAQRTLPAMIGLPPNSVQAASDDESVAEYVAKCNAAAQREGKDLRLHDVALDGDAFVFVAMTPQAFVALAKDGYLEQATG